MYSSWFIRTQLILRGKLKAWTGIELSSQDIHLSQRGEVGASDAFTGLSSHKWNT